MMTLGVVLLGYAQPRVEKTMSDGWQFSRDGSHWEEVRIPHDWAISGPFDKKWDLQVVAIEQNGEKVATEKSGRSGALPWIGDGEYKTTFQAACNGDAKSLEPFTQPRMKLFNGKLVVVVRSTSRPGPITLHVKAERQKMDQTLHFSSK